MLNENELTRGERVRLSALNEALGSFGTAVPLTEEVLARAKAFAKFIADGADERPGSEGEEPRDLGPM